MTVEQLRELFEAHGEVTSAKIITDKETNRSRGFGFVEMSDDTGQSAISAVNGQEVMGMQLRVNEARPRTENSFGGNSGYRNRNSNY